MSSNAKIRRLLDLMGVLLAHHYPRTFLELAPEIPGYAGALSDDATRIASAKRTFERDKKELKELGVPLETHGEEGSDETAYKIGTKEFYLPYLSVATPRGRSTPRKVDKWGYRALTTLTFEPDELEALGDAARRARQVGDPILAADADAAIRKLAFDLPIDAVDQGSEQLLASRAPADPRVLAELGDALVQRKRVAFEYHTIASDTVAAREVEPYGLFFLSGHWYLAARDVAKDALRNFRVNRISNSEVNATRAGSADYEIPATFRLREHARSRASWQIGDGDTLEATVEFMGASMAVATSLGEPVAGEQGVVRRRFNVRRIDAFVRWLLSFAGGARPIGPEEVVIEYRRQVGATLALYRDTALTSA